MKRGRRGGGYVRRGSVLRLESKGPSFSRGFDWTGESTSSAGILPAPDGGRDVRRTAAGTAALLGLTFPLEAVVSAALPGELFCDFQEGASGVREGGLLPVDEAQLALKVQLAHRNADQFSATDFILHADRRYQRHTVAHAHKALNGLQGGQLDVHVQGRLVLAEGFDDFVAIGRAYDVSDERLRSQLTDADFVRRSQCMSGGNHKHQLVEIDHRRFQLQFLRIVGEDSDLDVVLKDIIRDGAAQRTTYRDPNHGVQTTEFRQHRQQIEGGELVGGHHQLALLQFAELDQSFLCVLPQVEKFLGVFLEDASGVGQHTIARGAVEERLADFQLQLADGLADRRLGAEKLLRGAGEAALTGYCEEDFELGKVHTAVLGSQLSVLGSQFSVLGSQL